MYKIIDVEQWSRYEQFKFFKAYDNPFFNICSTLDVTKFVYYCKENTIPFSAALLFASIKTANHQKEFRFRMLDNKVVEYKSIYCGSTVLNDDQTFSFSYFDYFKSFKDFLNNYQSDVEQGKKGKIKFDGRNKDLDIIHYSIIPWISFTSFSHPRNYTTNDSIPKIVFGKYLINNSLIQLPISIEVHHALMDGFHMGKYLQSLQELLNTPQFLQD